MSSNIAPILLSREQVIPSSRFTEGRYPSALATHLSSMIPAPSTGLNALAASVETIKGGTSTDSKVSTSKTVKPTDNAGGGFLGMPSMNVKMDMRKWNWPGYLTFGKGNSTKPSIENLAMLSANAVKEKEGHTAVFSIHKGYESSQVEVPVNPDDLHDAITSDSISMSQSQGQSTGKEKRNSPDPDQLNGLIGENFLDDAIDETRGEETPPLAPPLPEFSFTRLHLASLNSAESKRVSIHYLVVGAQQVVSQQTHEFY